MCKNTTRRGREGRASEVGGGWAGDRGREGGREGGGRCRRRKKKRRRRREREGRGSLEEVRVRGKYVPRLAIS